MASMLMLVGAVGGTVGCARKVKIDGEPEAPAAVGPFTVYLAVANQGYFDVNVYLLRSSDAMGRRLGTVSGNSTRTFTFSDNQLQPGGRLQVMARAIGSRSGWNSPTLSVSPGNVAKLILVSGNSGELSRSQFYIEPGS
jgi:hypothetical protein